MIYHPVDWSVLRRPLLFISVTGSLVLVLISGVNSFSEVTDRAYREESNRLVMARAQHLALGDRKRRIERFYPRYQSFALRGIIGEASRDAWVEAFRQAVDAVKLPSLRYQITRQREGVFDLSAPSSRLHQVIVNEVILDMDLLHEGDMVAFFDALEHQSVGLFRLLDCRLKRLRGNIQKNVPNRANIRALCRMHWYTLEPHKKTTSPMEKST